ncbi:hypothetical protein SmJEL517_g01131 [Synchytrium microbalum]|uniref:Uncharacterized protein n=1 Tax=Synchytrium microbalum TaxID=1806994 RepID=A0A507CFC0_9FUNG|nr:uncharacterized protein SmJEL517_g01131 [Synchytrium microbalum]TPX36624.1 hypothetical protein SmJEL517_g01131 [Synchytrium microbalum]
MPTADYNQPTPSLTSPRRTTKTPSTYGSTGYSLQPELPTTPPRRSGGPALNYMATPPRTPTTIFRSGADYGISEREAGVQQQLKVLAAFEALRDGKLPTNEQLFKIIDQLASAPFLQQNRGRLSAEGRRALRNFERVAETLKRVISEKNANENIQHFIYHTRAASRDGAGGISAPALSDVQKGFSSMYNLGRLLLTNEEFRDLLYEFSATLQEVFFGTAQKVSAAKPAERKASQWGLDESKKRSKASMFDTTRRSQRSSTDSLGRTYKPGPVPDSLTVTGAGPQALPVTVHKSVPKSSTSSPESASPADASTENPPSEHLLSAGESSSSEKGLAGSIKSALGGESASGKVISALTESVQELPNEQLTLIMEKFRRVMSELQEYDEYQEAVSYMITLARQMGAVGFHHADASRRRGGSVADPNIRQAQHELFKLVENFANGQSLEPLFDSLFNIRSSMNSDRELRGLAHDVAHFLESSLKDPDFIEDQDYTYKGSQLINRARRILLDKYKVDTKNALDSIQAVLDGFSSDELTQKFGQDVRVLTQDLFLDENGRITIKTSLISDVFSVILPIVIEQIRYLPIPRIEHVDQTYHIIVENIILTSDTFLPINATFQNYLEIKIKNAALIALRRNDSSALSHGFTLNLHQIQANIEDMPFYFKRKTFPSITDCGVFLIPFTLAPIGITVMVKVAIDKDSRNRTLVPRRIRAFVDQLELNIHDSQYDTLYKALSPVLNNVLKTQIASAIETQVFDSIMSADEAITDWKVKHLLSEGPEYETDSEEGGGGGGGEGGRRLASKSTMSKFLGSIGASRASGISLKGQRKRPALGLGRGGGGKAGGYTSAWQTEIFD